MFSLMPMTNRMVAPNSGYGIKNFFEDFFNDFPAVSVKNDIKLDIRETEQEFIVDAELPGMKKENIKVDVEDNQLVISASIEENSDQEKENYIHRERRYSSISRMVYLPNIDQDAIKAKYSDGILSLNIPKKEIEDKKKAIAIE